MLQFSLMIVKTSLVLSAFPYIYAFPTLLKYERPAFNRSLAELKSSNVGSVVGWTAGLGIAGVGTVLATKKALDYFDRKNNQGSVEKDASDDNHETSRQSHAAVTDNLTGAPGTSGSQDKMAGGVHSPRYISKDEKETVGTSYFHGHNDKSAIDYGRGTNGDQCVVVNLKTRHELLQILGSSKPTCLKLRNPAICRFMTTFVRSLSKDSTFDNLKTLEILNLGKCLDWHMQFNAGSLPQLVENAPTNLEEIHFGYLSHSQIDLALKFKLTDANQVRESNGKSRLKSIRFISNQMNDDGSYKSHEIVDV